MNELELIRWIRERAPSHPSVRTGIGDDCAVIMAPGSGGLFVLTTDLLVCGTHFTEDDDPRAVGWKALAVSVSDVAAMGCRAVAAVVAVALREELTGDYARALVNGITEMAGEVGVALAGGDSTVTTGPVTICTTVTGEPPDGREPVLRSGARPGDALLVTGDLGGSLAGRHLNFLPRQPEGLVLNSDWDVHAMIDLSDGLSTDAGHLARESGVTLRFDSARIPISPAAADKDDPLTAALIDGEDFELLFAVASGDAGMLVAAGLAGTPVTLIGEVVAGPPEVLIIGPDGKETPLHGGGYEHFA